MAKVLFTVKGKFFHYDTNRAPTWGTCDLGVSVPLTISQWADDVYVERPNGYFKHLKSRFNNELHPLTNKEAFMWVLKSEYCDPGKGKPI